MTIMRNGLGVTPDRFAGRLLRLGSNLLDAWLPATCIVCGSARHDGLCGACETALPGYRVARCSRCGLGVADPVCAECLAEPPPFDRTVVLADYAPPLDRVVHALKYGRDAALARPLGRALARRLAALPDPPLGPIVTAIPLSIPRLAARGFNQSLELARALARAQRLCVDHRLLDRRRQGAPSATLHARERRVALTDAFAAPRRLAGRTVIVVDDVMTTGATLRAAATALTRAGAARVVNCVVARTSNADARHDAQRRPGPS